MKNNIGPLCYPEVNTIVCVLNLLSLTNLWSELNIFKIFVKKKSIIMNLCDQSSH